MRTELRPTSKERESCPLCREALGTEGPRVRCDRCRTAYHWACVDELGRGGCMTMACQGALIPENLPPPPTPSLNEELIARARERFTQRSPAPEEPAEPEQEPAAPPNAEVPPGGSAPLRIAIHARRGPVGTPLQDPARGEDQDYDEELKAWSPRRSSRDDPPPPPKSAARRARLGLFAGLLGLGLWVLSQGGAPAAVFLWIAAAYVYPWRNAE